MPMHQGIDLSRFKKISGDTKTSTLRHSKGHEIKIAHNGLSPKMFEMLKAMPVHLAEEGDVPPVPEQTEAADAAETPAPPAEAPAAAPPQTASFSVVPPGSYSKPTEAPPMPMEPGPDLSPEGKAQEIINHQNDVASGAVDPNTSSGLYANKSTPHKIGTLFGLLLSGIGSGMTHQPNMLMEMMNRELDRDLEAQKTNKTGALNFLNAKAQQNLLDAQAAEHRMNTIGKRGDVDRNSMNTYMYGHSQGIPGYETYPGYYMRLMNLASVEPEAKIAMITDTMGRIKKTAPNTPAAQAAVAGLEQHSNKEIAKLHQRGLEKGKKAAMDAANAPDARRPVLNERLLNQATALGGTLRPGDFRPNNAITPEEAAAIRTEKGEAGILRNGYYDAVDSFKKIAALPKAGQMPGLVEGVTAGSAGLGGLLGSLIPGGLGVGIGGALAGSAGHGAAKSLQQAWEDQRNTQTGALMQKLPNSWSEDAKKEFVVSHMPAWQDIDDPKRLGEKFRKMGQAFSSQEKTPTIDTVDDRFGHKFKTPFPQLEFSMPEKAKNDAPPPKQDKIEVPKEVKKEGKKPMFEWHPYKG